MKRTVAWIGLMTSLFACSESRQTAPSQPVAAHDRNLAIALAHPETATQLTLDFNPELKSLPAELWTLTNLRELNFSCPEGLYTLPPEVGRLRLLEKLIFDCGNGGSMNLKLPEEIGNLKNLTVLRLYGALDPREQGEKSLPRSAFKDLPEGIRFLTNLKELDLGRNGLPDVPPQLGSLVNLEKLGLSFNEIHELPQFLANLRKLRELSLLENGGVSLPGSLSRIKGLKVAAGNNSFDLKAQGSLRQRFPNISFDFENEYDDCAANEPVGGYPQWQRETCGILTDRKDRPTF